MGLNQWQYLLYLSLSFDVSHILRSFFWFQTPFPSFLPPVRFDLKHLSQYAGADGGLPAFPNPGFRSSSPGAIISAATMWLDSRNNIIVVEKKSFMISSLHSCFSFSLFSIFQSPGPQSPLLPLRPFDRLWGVQAPEAKFGSSVRPSHPSHPSRSARPFSPSPPHFRPLRPNFINPSSPSFFLLSAT
jgi:hypothetical protein